ncbi:MAG: hypothetical protein AAF799_41990 [Myxococcota bacterium]
MSRTHRPHVLTSLGIAACLALPAACSKSGDEEETKAEANKDASSSDEKADGAKAKTGDESAKNNAGGGAEAARQVTALGKTVADGIADAAGGIERLDPEHALGHFLLPNGATLIEDVSSNIAPSGQAAIVSEPMLRMAMSGVLGSRSGVSQHLALDKPMGCMISDSTATDFPVACVMGYTGGLSAAITDMGADGKQGDAAGHGALYRIEGQDVYLDEVDGHVVVSNHPEVFGTAKHYIKANLIDRAPSVKEDIEVVLYPKSAMSRYSKEVDTLLATMRGAPTPPTGNPMIDAFTNYSRTSVDTSFDYYREIDQLDLGLSIEEIGVVFHFATHPTEGSKMQADAQAISAGAVDQDLVNQLPIESWLVTTSTINWDAAWKLESSATMRDAMIEIYGEAVGRDPAEVKTALEAYFEETAKLFAHDTAMGIAHLPGSQGGMIIHRKLNAPARESFRAWSEGFTPEKVLGPEGSKYVTWSFEMDATKVDGIAVDRWTVEPGVEAKKEMAKKPDPALAEIEKRFGGVKLVVNRIELDDRVIVVVAPGSDEQYIKAALAAAKGGTGVGSDTGFATALKRNPKTSMIMAADIAGAADWARAVLPPEATRKLPPGIGRDLGDFYFSVTYGESGSQHGEMVLSQGVIDQLRALAD